MRTIRQFLLIVFLSAYCSWAFCQGIPITCGELTVAQGLLPGTVNSIYQDYLGYIWIGTKSGLNRYDTKSVKTFLANKSDSSALWGSQIRMIFEDRQNRLWIGTNEGLNIYNRAMDSFTSVFMEDSLSSYSANVIWEEASGILFLGTNKGLFRIDEEDLTLASVNYVNSGKPISNDIRDIFLDGDGEVWLSSSSGLKRLTFDSSLGFSHLTTYTAKPGSVNDNSLFDIIEPEKGKIWVSSKRGGINVFDKSTQTFDYITVDAKDSIKISSNDVRSVMKDKSGGIWIGTFAGLDYYHPNDGHVHYSTAEGEYGSLNHSSVLSLFEDRKGSIWVGTFYGGISVLDRDIQSFINYAHHTHKNSISHNIISSIAEDETGNLWIGTEGGGLNFVDKLDGEISHFTFSENDYYGINHNNVKSLKLDSSGNLWIGTYAGGLNLLSKGSKHFESFKTNSANEKSISNNNIYAITEDYLGDLWFGTFGGGLNRMKKGQKGEFERFSTRSDSAHLISSNLVRVVYEDSQKNLWVGTEDGLNVKFFGENVFEVFYGNSFEKNGLSGNLITSIFEDSKGRLWIGTYNSGLNLYHPSSKDFSHFSKEDGLPCNTIAGILEDNDGFLWLSTNNGLCKFAPGERYGEIYTAADGIAGNEFLSGSSTKLRDGRLAFGGTRGLTLFRPRLKSKVDSHLHSLVFTDFRLFNQSQKIGKSQVLETAITLTEKLNLKHDQNNFSFDFASLNYLFPHKNKFAYMLEGFDKDWQYVDTPSCTYTNLDPGNYTLLVKGTNNNGVWSEEPKRMSIIILPPVWKTWWAYLGYFLIGGLTVGKLYHFNRSKLQLEKRLFLEKNEKEKQMEISEEKFRFFTNISHEFRTPLTLILAPVDRILNRSSLDQEQKSMLETVKSNAHWLLGLVNQLMDFRKTELGKFQVRAKDTDLISFVRKLLEPFQSYARDEQISLQFKHEVDKLPVYVDAGMVETVVINLISNAFKFKTDFGKVIVSISEEPQSEKYPLGVAVIEVSDNGIGISPEELPFIFERFYQGKATSSSNKPILNSSGVGLSLAKNLIELHGGKISVLSSPAIAGKNGHTVFRVMLPKGSDHFEKDQLLESTISLIEPTTNLIIPHVISVKGPPEKTRKQNQILRKIMVVEDNNKLRELIVHELSDNFEVVEAEDGLKAWEIIIKEMPELIVSDVMMPGIDGFELLNRIRSNVKTSHIPVILLTARDGLPDKLRGFRSGVDHYITKPFEMNILLLNISNMLESIKRQKRLFIRQFLINPEDTSFDNPEKEFLVNALDLVESNLENERFSVKELSIEIGMSRPVLYRKLKQLTGLSVIDFINQIRFKKAASLLKMGNLSVVDVANRVGFSDPKHFRKSFKLFFGCNPSEYSKISEKINENV